jgi:hypothetical protein
MEHALQFCTRRHTKLGLLIASMTCDEEGGTTILENYEGIENLGRASRQNSIGNTEYPHAGDSRPQEGMGIEREDEAEGPEVTVGVGGTWVGIGMGIGMGIMEMVMGGLGVECPRQT